MATMEMECWKGDWGLPSVDINCLNVMTYAQFAGAPIKIHRNRPLWKNMKAAFPVFRTGDTELQSADSIIQHLKQNDFDADAKLTDQQRADVLAYSALLEEKLLPALLYTWWLDAKNHIELSRPWFAKALHFPFNYFIPGRLQRSAELRVETTRGGLHLQDGELVQKVLKDAKECLNLLSERLGQTEFFFGESPSSLDALVFSHLAPLIRVPFPSNSLQVHCKACDNLVLFCSRILQRYFPPDPEDPQTEPEEPKKPGDSFDDPHKRRNQVLAVLFAAAAMVGYALLSGLVRLELVDEDDDLDEEEMIDEEGDMDYREEEG